MAENVDQDLPSFEGCGKGSVGAAGGSESTFESSDGKIVGGLKSVAGRRKFRTPREFMAERNQIENLGVKLGVGTASATLQIERIGGSDAQEVVEGSRGRAGNDVGRSAE